MFSPEDLGKALRLLRARRAMTQEEVADKTTSITKSMLSSYELGLKLPSFGSLVAVLGALGEDFHDLQEALAEIRTERPFKIPIKSENVGQALRLLRVQRKLTQTAVANKAKITKAMLSCYETGSQLPSLQSLGAVLTALDYDFHSFHEALLLESREGERSRVGKAPRSRRPALGVEPAPIAGFSFEPEEDGQALIAAFESLEGPTVRAILWIERPRTTGGPHPDHKGEEWTRIGPE